MRTKPTPIRIPEDLEKEIKAASEFTRLPDQEVMRLAMRIGLVDLRASKHIAGILQQVATDKGQSFLAWAREQQSLGHQNLSEPAAAAASPPITAASHPQKTPTAKIVKLPRPTTPESELKVAEPTAEFKFTDRSKQA